MEETQWFKLYKNKNWLKQKYINEKLTLNNIAKICKVNLITIRYWMIKFNIPIRSKSESLHLVKTNHCNLSKKLIEWISGELLGDGCLNPSSIWSARFGYTSKYREYIQYISDTLKSFGIKQVGNIRKYYHKEMNCYTYHYYSLSYAELLTIYKKWYLNGKKNIPNDLELTPLILRQHFIGDGSIRHRKNRRPHIILATCGFPISNVEQLKEKINKLGFKTKRWISNNAIGISTYSTKDFLNYIGKCPVKCYQYKFIY